LFFILVCTNFYINVLHLPYNPDLSLQSKACTATACRGLRPALRTAWGPRSEGRGLAHGIWALGASDCPRCVSDASSCPAGMHLKECWSLSGNPGWWLESGHKVGGSVHVQHHRPHIPGRLECGHHSSVPMPRTREARGGDPQHTARSVWPTGAETQDHSQAGRARPGVGHSCWSTVTAWGSPELGSPSLRLGSLLRHTATGLGREVPQVPQKPCKIKSA